MWKLTSATAESPTEGRCGLQQEPDDAVLLALRDQHADRLRSLFFGVPFDQIVPHFSKDADVEEIACQFPGAFGSRLRDSVAGLPAGQWEGFELLERLFPSVSMPSDHPAVGVHFSLSLVP